MDDVTPEVMRTLLAERARFLAFVERRVGSRDVAEEILQEAFVRGLEKAYAIREGESAVAWFYRLLRNAVIDRARRAASANRALDAWARELEVQDAARGVEERTICACVAGLVDTMKPEYAEAVRAVDVEGAEVRALVAQADLRAGQTVLDLGCGTATLTTLAKAACPDARVIGIDPDAKVLDLARANVARAGVDVELVRATVEDAPIADRIVSSLMFHHLDADGKRRALRRALALLRPGGEIHIADWGRAQSRAARAAFVVVQLLDGFATTTENVRRGLLPALGECGFEDA